MSESRYHMEVRNALQEIGDCKLARRIAKDGRSRLVYCGVRVPARRNRVKEGFSFIDLPAGEVLQIWHDLWTRSDNGDVMFCALDYYRFRVRKKVEHDYWPVMRTWVDRVENWAHADDLSGILSRLLAANTDRVLPQVETWVRSNDLWLRRVGIVGTINYTGKNAVFLDAERSFAMLRPTLVDHRYYIQKATGWVLRELQQVYPAEFEDFLSLHLQEIGPYALTRAIEKLDGPTRQLWRDRKRRL